MKTTIRLTPSEIAAIICDHFHSSIAGVEWNIEMVGDDRFGSTYPSFTGADIRLDIDPTVLKNALAESKA